MTKKLKGDAEILFESEERKKHIILFLIVHLFNLKFLKL